MSPPKVYTLTVTADDNIGEAAFRVLSDMMLGNEPGSRVGLIVNGCRLLEEHTHNEMVLIEYAVMVLRQIYEKY